MYILKIDPRALKENPDRSRQTKSTPQADALLLASIKAVGVVQPPVVSQETDGGNGFIIDAGHRRTRLAIKAGLEEIAVVVDEAASGNGAMRSLAENIGHEPLNPVDLWRAIERLAGLDWSDEAIAVALALPSRRIKQLRLLATVLPAMLDHMAKGDLPNEQQLRTIAAAAIDEQKEVWKRYKPSKESPRVDWWRVAQALTKTRMYARDASFGDDLAQAYGIEWATDLFAPENEDSRYTTNVEAFLGAQQEWMTNNLPKKGVIAEVNDYGQIKLPPKAERVHGKQAKSDITALYLDRNGKVQSVVYRLPDPKKAKGKNGSDGSDVATRPRPDVTRKGSDMIGDFRTDALHEALARSPIEDDTLMALLVLAFAGRNITVVSGSGDDTYGFARMDRHAVRLIGEDGKLGFDRETLQQAARAVLVDVLSCRESRSQSGIVARIAGEAIGADAFLPNMGTEEFLSCLSRPALEGSCKDTSVLPRQRVKDTRAALVEHFKEGRFVHTSALFAPETSEVTNWLARYEADTDEDLDDDVEAPIDEPADSDGDSPSHEGEFREAAE